MKKTILTFILVLMSMIFFGSCEKIEDRRGTLTVKIVNAEFDSSTKLQVSVYPYIEDINRFRLIAQSNVNKSASSSVSFILNEGNYYITCESYSNIKACQVQAGEETVITF
ncbi:MAG: hypothetical protein IKY16_01850 [Bacteroidales bacterium]|nr:hypothetical protein [Bacteroidales bacterium]